MADPLRSLSYPSLDAIALGSALPIGLEPLAFSSDGLSLLVKVSFIDSGVIGSGGAASTRSAIFVYDVNAKSYSTDLCTLIGSQPSLVGAPINLLDAQFSNGDDRVLVHYTVPDLQSAPGASPGSHLAVIDLATTQPSVVREDLIASVLGQSGVDVYVEAMRLSEDGRSVAVQTASPLLLDDVLDNNDRSDIYLIDTQTLTVRRVSEIAGVGPPQGEASLLQDIHLNSDGSVQVLFASNASFANLDDNASQDLYLWQARPAAAAALTLISRQSGKAFGAETGFISDGQVLFQRTVGDEVRLYRTSLTSAGDATALSGLDEYYSPNFALQGLSYDGSLMLFSSDRGPGLGQSSPVQMFAHGPLRGLTALVSAASAAASPADDQIVTPAMSADGGQFAFVSRASNLGAGQLQGTFDVLYVGSIDAYGSLRNRAPTGSDRLITTLEDTTYTFGISDFGFVDPDAGDSLGAVRVDTLPAASKGGLVLGSAAVVAGQLIEGSQISLLKFEPATNLAGSSATSFTFSVRDAQLFDPISRTITVGLTPVNDRPTGSVTISGSARQGETLTVSNSVADVDGLGPISYQWKAAGENIAGATGSALTLTQALVGKAISVVANYIDQQSTAESVTSAATTEVTNVNDQPTGSVTIVGTARQGETLTVSNSVADVDGLGPISYQWKAAGENIAGATGSALTLTQALVGKAITVVASYTDQQKTGESITSAATTAVTNVNDAPTGTNKPLTIQKGATYLFGVADFGFADPDTGDVLGAVRIDSLPLSSKGVLKLGAAPVSAGQVIDAAQIPNLKFEPAANVSGVNAAAFNFSVRDAQLFDAAPNTLSVHIAAPDWVALSGRIYHWKTHALLGGVGLGLESSALLSVQAVNTASNGSYSLSIPDDGGYRVQASKPLGSSETGSVISAADALAALKLSVGINPNPDPDGAGSLTAPPVSPYQFLAADVNGDGRVSAADALAILKMAVKRSDAPARDWLFVNEAHDFWNESVPNGGAFTTTRSAVPKDAVMPRSVEIVDGSPLNLVAVLKGDVNGNWAAPTGSTTLPDSYFQTLVGGNPLTMNLTQFGVVNTGAVLG
jgi:hypothetical protein